MPIQLSLYSKIIIKQKRELAEIFGFETRNKYEIYDESNNLIGFCAEQSKGFFGFLLRQFFGHWRSFELHFFDNNRVEFLKTNHPFRFFFQEFSVVDSQNKLIGYVKQRFGILTKKFDIHDSQGQLLLTMRSGFLSFWTFPFYNQAGDERALVQKKWSGFLKELFLDADNFLVTFNDANLKESERQLVLAASVFTDLQYFEKKAD